MAGVGFAQDVAETLLVVGKLAKLGKLRKVGSLSKLTHFDPKIAYATIALTESIVAAINVKGAIEDFKEGNNFNGAVKSVDALFSVIGVSFTASKFLKARADFKGAKALSKADDIPDLPATGQYSFNNGGGCFVAGTLVHVQAIPKTSFSVNSISQHHNQMGSTSHESGSPDIAVLESESSNELLGMDYWGHCTSLTGVTNP